MKITISHVICHDSWPKAWLLSCNNGGYEPPWCLFGIMKYPECESGAEATGIILGSVTDQEKQQYCLVVWNMFYFP